jgi:dephospho-CoA kinase|eukprot:g3719.t1
MAGVGSSAAAAKRVVVGLTGGIAAGKSTIAKIMKSFGATVIDADKIGHQVYEPGTKCLADVVDQFGPSVINPADGSLNRRVLGDIVFNPEEPENLKRLNSIVWPHIEESICRRIDEHKSGVLVVEAAVMVEAGWATKSNDNPYDELWVAWVDVKTAKVRLMERNGFSEDEAMKRINSQISNEERLQHAQVSVETKYESLDGLKRRVAAEWTGLVDRHGLKALSASEMVAVVDEQNNVIGEALREKVRGENLRHRATYIFVRHTDSKQLYVQERTLLKDYCPGYLDPVTGGVVAANETYEENAKREIEEELGLTGDSVSSMSHMFTFYHEDPAAKVWGDAWLCETNVPVEDMVLQPEEVQSVRLMSVEEILQMGQSPSGATVPGERITPDGLEAVKRYVEFLGKQ